MVIIFIHSVVSLYAPGTVGVPVKRTITLHTPHRGFDAETEFEQIARYGSWHPARAKLETTDGEYRIEVTAEELRQFFAA